MITRISMFKGPIHAGQEAAFREAVVAGLLPKRQKLPGARDVRICFTDEADEDAPSFPFILEIDYDDLDAVQTALNSPARVLVKQATEALLPRFFVGRLNHHISTKAA